MPRAQSSFAIVNAGFLYKINQNHKVQESRVVFGGLSPSFVRAMKCEDILRNKDLFSNTTLQVAIRTLKQELIVSHDPPEYSVEYKTQLSLALFYKLSISLSSDCPIDNWKYNIENL